MKMGFVTMTTIVLPSSVNGNNLLSWQLINSSHTPINKPFVAIDTAKCRSEDVATVATITTGHGLTETM